MTKQLALKTTKDDIQEFYVGILGGKVEGHHSIDVKEAIKSFNIPQEAEVYELKLQDMLLELYTYEACEEDSLQHFNLELEKATNAFMKAYGKNYWTSMRKIKDKETYFIKDKNNNLFELKERM